MNIKDYLHLYLGCEVQTEFGVATLVVVGILGSSDQIARTMLPGMSMTDAWLETNKPILRPLSDMTEEEKKELIKYENLIKTYNDVKFHDDIINDKLTGIVIQYSHKISESSWDWECPQTWVLRFHAMNAYDFRWLLSKGFDLFGLIDAGLATDKTKIK